jgi:aminoglycoside phosphotransferase (APT) family kinase protein
MIPTVIVSEICPPWRTACALRRASARDIQYRETEGVDQPIGEAERASRLMRERPPAAALAWLVAELDVSAVVDVAPMRGGSTAAMHRVTIVDRSGLEQTVVFRRYVRQDVLAAAPDVAAVEGRALQLAERLPLPTPALLALDATGVNAGAPALVMTMLAGRPVWETRWASKWVSQAVDAMIALHELPAADGDLPPLATYAQKRYEPPRWTTKPALWERAFEVFHGPVPTADVGFVHRDFNPGNVLWIRDRLSGLVDWQWACIGPRSIDPAHCRLNLFQYNPGMAEDVRTVWEQRSGLTFDPWADLASIIGTLDNIRGRREANAAMRSIEGALQRAVADLG